MTYINLMIEMSERIHYEPSTKKTTGSTTITISVKNLKHLWVLRRMIGYRNHNELLSDMLAYPKLLDFLVSKHPESAFNPTPKQLEALRKRDGHGHELIMVQLQPNKFLEVKKNG